MQLHTVLPLRRLLWFALLITVPACREGDGLARVEVRGSVTFQGTPVKHGLITFLPAHGSKGPAAGTAIADGKFLLPVEKGPTAGPHEVEVKIVGADNDSKQSSNSRPTTPGAGQMQSFSQQVDLKSGLNELKISLPLTPPSSDKSAR